MLSFIVVKSRTARLVMEMADIFVKKQVARSAAALSYYLTITVFPFLICVSAILGKLHVQQSEILSFLSDILPEGFSVGITGFLDNLGSYSNELMLSIGLVALLTSSSASFRSFISIMAQIQGKRRFSGFLGAIFSFVFSIGLLLAIYLSGLVILSGDWFMQLLNTYFSFGNVFAIWTWVRFIFLFLLMFSFIYGAYFISAPKETKRTHRLPGAIIAAVVLVIASALYSRMITASIRYAVLYGSLASFVIIMIWLYTCGTILIMGNVFNISLRKTSESVFQNRA